MANSGVHGGKLEINTIKNDLKGNVCSIYRVGQIKRGQLTFLLITSEPIYKIK